MFDYKHYVPILRWKRGEQKALEFLDANIKEKITPLIEIPPIDWDYENDVPKCTIEQHLEDIGRIVKQSWGLNRPVFVDLQILVAQDGSYLDNGQHVVEHVIENIHQQGTKAIPVTGYNRDADFHRAIQNTITKYGNGVCIRLEEADFDDIPQRLDSLLQIYQLKAKQVDLLIDFKYVRPSDENKTLHYALGVLISIPRLSEWRTLTFACTAFPEDLRDIPTGTDGAIPRSEWTLYKHILKINNLSRYPAFGDYGISNPFYNDIDPRIMTLAANIRYTVEEQFLIFRGKSVKDPKYGGWKQTAQLCQRLITSGYYKGESYSYGDKYIYECANGGNSGNAETWRRVGTNHHLTLAVNALSILHGI